MPTRAAMPCALAASATAATKSPSRACPCDWFAWVLAGSKNIAASGRTARSAPSAALAAMSSVTCRVLSSMSSPAVNWATATLMAMSDPSVGERRVGGCGWSVQRALRVDEQPADRSEYAGDGHDDEGEAPVAADADEQGGEDLPERGGEVAAEVGEPGDRRRVPA